MPELRALRPLRERDFALLFTGIAVSLLGDGITLVALVWQVYDISNEPSAFSLVGLAWTLPMVAFLLVGGVLADRIPRRQLLIAADVLRGLSLAAIGVLSLSGVIELWHVVALAVPFGIGQALFAPAFDATIPEIVPRRMLVEANSLRGLAEPVAYRFAGPAIGGALVAGLGPGVAFLVDAGTFAFSAICVSLMRGRPAALRGTRLPVRREIGEGLAFVRSQPWLWATLLAAALVLLLHFGPMDVLLPFLIRNELGGGAEGFGLVLAASGVGAVVVALVLGQRGLWRRHVLVMYLAWGFAVGSLALFPLAGSVQAAMLIGLAMGVANTTGDITWATLIQTHVPNEVLGRVSSLDWFVSLGLTPVSFALAGPAAAAFGVEETMIGAGVLAAVAMLAVLAVPGVRDPEHWPR